MSEIALTYSFLLHFKLPTSCSLMFFLHAGLSQQRFHDITAHIGKAIVTTVESIGQSFVIESELMQDRRVKIGH